MKNKEHERRKEGKKHELEQCELNKKRKASAHQKRRKVAKTTNRSSPRE